MHITAIVLIVVGFISIITGLSKAIYYIIQMCKEIESMLLNYMENLDNDEQ